MPSNPGPQIQYATSSVLPIRDFFSNTIRKILHSKLLELKTKELKTFNFFFFYQNEIPSYLSYWFTKHEINARLKECVINTNLVP